MDPTPINVNKQWGLVCKKINHVRIKIKGFHAGTKLKTSAKCREKILNVT